MSRIIDFHTRQVRESNAAPDVPVIPQPPNPVVGTVTFAPPVMFPPKAPFDITKILREMTDKQLADAKGDSK